MKRNIVVVIIVLFTIGLTGLLYVLQNEGRKELPVEPKYSSYEIRYSEQEYLKKNVSTNENFIVNWVSSYVGKDTNVYRGNTNSLKVIDIDSSQGVFEGVNEIYKIYPNLKDIISSVAITYSYDEREQEIVQNVTVDRKSLKDRVSVYVVYNKDAQVEDFYYFKEAI